MSDSIVVCSRCGESSAVVEWGFVLLARYGWSAQLPEAGREQKWRCPVCSAANGQGLESTADQPVRERLRVLLVDDQVLVLGATRSMLGDLDVVTAGGAAEALDKLAEGSHFDAVVSDVSMPGVSGPELFVQICEQYPHLAEKVLLVSGDGYGAARSCAAVARREGLTRTPRVLEKPVPRDELVRAIEGVARRHPRHSGAFSIEAEHPNARAKAK